MEHIYDMIVIGGGPAGYTAAMYAARAGLDTVVAERLSVGGQMAVTGVIENYPGFDEGVDGFTLGMNMQKGAERFGAKTVYAEVAAADLSQRVKRVETADGTLLGKTVVIATGADPRTLGLKDEQALVGRGVHYCAHCDGRFYRGKTVLVVGGGNTAAEDALYLSRLAKKVYVVHRRDTLRATAVYREALEHCENVAFLWDSTVTGFLTDGGFHGAVVTHVKDGQDTRLACDGVFVSIGRKPATELFRGQLALDSAGYIVAGESTETGIPGVYAAGDVRTKALRQVVTAVSDGAVAVHYAEQYLTENG